MSAEFHACYVDSRVLAPGVLSSTDGPASALMGEHSGVADNLRKIVSIFNNATSHSSAKSCLEHLASSGISRPTALFINMPSADDAESHFGLELLQELQRVYSATGRISPVALVDDEIAEMPKYIDMGAIEVINRNIDEARLRGIFVQLYRNKSRPKRASRVGWFGGGMKQSKAILEERLIDSLFDVMFFDMPAPSDLAPLIPTTTSQERAAYLKSIIGLWDFPVQDLSDDDLMQCAHYIFLHAFTVPELKDKIISDDDLKRFLSVLRAAYQPQNPYHNFRHVVDVLQATFSFLLALSALPPYPSTSPVTMPSNSSLAHLLEPLDALALLVTAIGHDVGHPGVTNAFLIASRSPLARMYNERSVLESFHSAAFNQILERFWPVMQQQPVKSTIVDAVFATDMALHFDYMQQLNELLHSTRSLTVEVDDKEKQRRKRLLCSSLVKCADISNVARRLDISTHWGMALTEEFKKMAALEIELNLKAPLPVTNPEPPCSLSLEEQQVRALAKSQLFFIDSFALPLFVAISGVLPELSYTTDLITQNKTTWESRLDELTSKLR